MARTGRGKIRERTASMLDKQETAPADVDQRMNHENSTFPMIKNRVDASRYTVETLVRFRTLYDCYLHMQLCPLGIC